MRHLNNIFDYDYANSTRGKIAALLGLKKRIKAPGLASDPKIYQRGKTLVLSIRYWPKGRFKVWVKAQKPLRIVTVITAISGAAIVYNGETSLFTQLLSGTIGALSFGIAAFSFCGKKLVDRWGCKFFGKSAVVDFRAEYIKVYQHGYGIPISHPKMDTVAETKADADHTLSEGVFNREHMDREEENVGAIDTNMKKDLFSVRIHYGGITQEVALLYGKAQADALVLGIKSSEYIRQEIISRREEQATALWESVA